METMILISAINDRKKAMKWLREKEGWTLDQVQKLSTGGLPFPYKARSLDVKWYLDYAREWGLDEVERVSRDGALSPFAGCKPLAVPDPAECGFETASEVASTPEERSMFLDKIGELREVREALEWYEAQPADVKRKIELLRPRPPMG